MPRLSILQAIRKGREIVPNFASKALVGKATAKGYDDVTWDGWGERWVRTSDTTGKEYEITAPVVAGSACILGAAAIAMGMDLIDMMGDDGSYYVHPDFVLVKQVLVGRPDGWISDGEDFTAESIAMALYPCHEVDTTEYGSGVVRRKDFLPIIIAHLNDMHDPRNPKTGLRDDLARKEPWTEDQIIEWLRGLGYNGEGNHKA